MKGRVARAAFPHVTLRLFERYPNESVNNYVDLEGTKSNYNRILTDVPQGFTGPTRSSALYDDTLTISHNQARTSTSLSMQTIQHWVAI